MADEQLLMQHSTKAAAGFTHEGVSIASDDDGFIAIAPHISGKAKEHGFDAVSEKPVKSKKPLAKIADEGGSEDANPEKPAEEDAPKAVKGGRK